MIDITKMTQDEFNQYLESNKIDEMHEAYDELWSTWMFGGENPNELIEKIRSEYRSENSEPSAETIAKVEKERQEREWFLNHPSA